MSVLVIGQEEKRQIEFALQTARAKPVPWELLKDVAIDSETTTLTLKERKPGVDELRKEYPPQNVLLGTYRVAISFEEQPAGLLRHLSISSSHAKGWLPREEVMGMVIPEFGFSGWPLQRPGRVWVEEYEPGALAVNVIELEDD